MNLRKLAATAITALGLATLASPAHAQSKPLPVVEDSKSKTTSNTVKAIPGETSEKVPIPGDTFEKKHIPGDTFERKQIPGDTFERKQIPGDTFERDANLATSSKTSPQR